ncbi:hypothetical protein GCM10009780_58010 [Actinomadura alba]
MPPPQGEGADLGFVAGEAGIAQVDLTTADGDGGGPVGGLPAGAAAGAAERPGGSVRSARPAGAAAVRPGSGEISVTACRFSSREDGSVPIGTAGLSA